MEWDPKRDLLESNALSDIQLWSMVIIGAIIQETRKRSACCSQEVHNLLFSGRSDSIRFNPPAMPFSISSTWQTLPYLLRPISRDVSLFRPGGRVRWNFLLCSPLQSHIAYQAKVEPVICHLSLNVSMNSLSSGALFLFVSPLSSMVSGIFQAQSKF